jgi:acyl-CoA thioesterase FadM
MTAIFIVLFRVGAGMVSPDLFAAGGHANTPRGNGQCRPGAKPACIASPQQANSDAMNLWVRLVLLIVALLWRPRLNPREPSLLHFRVLPTDLDTNLHMNNGRYLTIMDLGRLDLMLRSGLWRPLWRNDWAPMAGAVVIRFRRELRLFERFVLRTRIAAWSDTTAVMEQAFFFADGARKGQMAACALMKAGFYDRGDRRLITVKRLIAELGVPAEATQSPPASPDIEAFLKAEAALRRAGGNPGDQDAAAAME